MVFFSFWLLGSGFFWWCVVFFWRSYLVFDNIEEQNRTQETGGLVF